MSEQVMNYEVTRMIDGREFRIRNLDEPSIKTIKEVKNEFRILRNRENGWRDAADQFEELALESRSDATWCLSELEKKLVSATRWKKKYATRLVDAAARVAEFDELERQAGREHCGPITDKRGDLLSEEDRHPDLKPMEGTDHVVNLTGFGRRDERWTD